MATGSRHAFADEIHRHPTPAEVSDTWTPHTVTATGVERGRQRRSLRANHRSKMPAPEIPGFHDPRRNGHISAGMLNTRQCRERHRNQAPEHNALRAVPLGIHGAGNWREVRRRARRSDA